MKNCFGGKPLGDDGLHCTHKFKSEIQAGGRNGKYVCMGQKIWRSPLVL